MHAVSSAKKFGGEPDDYIDIHDWFDCTKQYTGDFSHRAMRHHSAGIQWAIEEFTHAIENSNGKMIPVKLIAEQHVMEDCGFIPTIQDWMQPIKDAPADWMLKVQKKTTQVLEVK
jgi:hypothetical protein